MAKKKKGKKNKPMTKSQIMTYLAEENELPKKKVKQFMESLVELAYAEASKGFTIPGLGKLVIVNRKARMARNPQTGEKIKVPARKALKFRIAAVAKRTLTPKPKTKKVKGKKGKGKKK